MQHLHGVVDGSLNGASELETRRFKLTGRDLMWKLIHDLAVKHFDLQSETVDADRPHHFVNGLISRDDVKQLIGEDLKATSHAGWHRPHPGDQDMGVFDETWCATG